MQADRLTEALRRAARSGPVACETLTAHGVNGYDRRALEDDYRLSALWQITTRLRQAAHGVPPSIWWNNLERIMLAVDDLGCRELLA